MFAHFSSGQVIITFKPVYDVIFNLFAIQCLKTGHNELTGNNNNLTLEVGVRL
jgi:hypothetical protein